LYKNYRRQSFFAPNSLSHRAIHGAGKENVMMNIIKRSCLFLAGILFLACGGSPAPVSAAPPPSADELDAAIRETSDYLNQQLPKGNKLVILNIQSAYPALSEYIIDELIANTVNDRLFSVVDRRQLDTIRTELDFQYSGEVDDDTMQELGRMAGAQIIISGAVSKIGDLYRLRVRALSVQTASIEGQFNRNIPEGTTIAALARSQATGYGESGEHTTNPTTTPTGGAIETNTPVPAVTAASAPVQTPVAPTYKIGDTGPAGGLIFYDKGNNSGGWRYLEAASEDVGVVQWGIKMITGASAAEIGTGNRNTRILAGYTEGKAAQLCRQYNQGGYNDWYLPSKDELNWMYTNLERKSLGDFNLSGFYWSSTEINDSSAWIQRFSDGFQEGAQRTYNSGDNYKERSYLVRPIRQV
jgi:hypothetical protein